MVLTIKLEVTQARIDLMFLTNLGFRLANSFTSSAFTVLLLACLKSKKY